MEKRSGFKECPKCGLRNKPGATQCDFCGQNLGPSDDWQQHIRDLESLNKMELRRPLDDRTSKRIEATIIRKDAPVARSVEIKEAGNVGKALKELDDFPYRDEDRESKDDRSRQQPAQDRLRIKEASSVPLAEKEPEEAPIGPGTTIADILKGPVEGREKLPEPLTVEQEPAPGPPVITAAEEPAKEIEEPPQLSDETPSEPEKTEVAPAQVSEPVPEEKVDEPVPVAPLEPPEEIVPAMEVTVEVVQPPQEEVASDQGSGAGEGEVALSTNDSTETIKLKLVEVERPREKLLPTIVPTNLGPRGMAAIAMLALGTVAYLVILGLTAIGALGTVVGLGGGAVSSFMIISGAAVVYPSIRRRKEDEVYICPKCHEKVEESSEGCPACGAEFDPRD